MNKLKPYLFPIIKILPALAVIILSVKRNDIYYIEEMSIRRMVGFACILLSAAAIYFIFIAIRELFEIHSKREKQRPLSEKETKNSKQFALNDVATIVKAESIVSFVAWYYGDRIKFGSASDYDRTTGEFFDKAFYVEDKTFTDIEEFKTELHKYSVCSVLTVISIDDLPPDEYSFDLSKKAINLTYSQLKAVLTGLKDYGSVEVEFAVSGDTEYQECWMGHTWHNNYWFGLTPDCMQGYDFDSFEELVNAKVFHGKSLKEILDIVEILSIDGCDPEERLPYYPGE